MTHRPYDRQFTVPSGAVLKSGGSLNLVEGQVGLFSPMETSVDGMVAYFDLKGFAEDAVFEIREGRGLTDNSRSQSEKDYSTPPFRLSEVVRVRASLPQRDKMSVDHVVLGHNGIDENTTIKVKKGQTIPVAVKLRGQALALRGVPGGVVVLKDYIGVDPCRYVNPMVATCEECEPCEQIDCSKYIKEFIERIKKTPIDNLSIAEEFMFVKPAISCRPDSTPIPYSFWTTSMCDTGDEYAIALIAAQYPKYKVIRKNRIGSDSVYEMLVPDADGTPAKAKQTFESLVKNCADCPSGYEKLTGGYIYSVSLVDNGTDQSSIIETLPNAATGSAIRHGGHISQGYYSVVLTEKLTKEARETFVDSNPSFIVHAFGLVGDFCKDTAELEHDWVKGDTCNTTTHEYQIDVPDDECGVNRLKDLQLFYPDLTIEIVQDGQPAAPVTGGCLTRFKTTIETNLVCDECDPIYKDYFKSKAPEPFEGNKWKVAEETTTSTDCLCGVHFEGKVISLDPGVCFQDQMDYFEDSVRIEVSAGVRESNILNYEEYDSLIPTTYLSRWMPRTHLGVNLMRYERESHKYFTGESTHNKLFARAMRGELTKLEGGKQYVDYILTVRPHRYSGGKSEITQDTIDYHFIVELGRGDDVKQMLNNIAIAAGKPIIQEFGS